MATPWQGKAAAWADGPVAWVVEETAFGVTAARADWRASQVAVRGLVTAPLAQGEFSANQPSVVTRAVVAVDSAPVNGLVGTGLAVPANQAPGTCVTVPLRLGLDGTQGWCRVPVQPAVLGLAVGFWTGNAVREVLCRDCPLTTVCQAPGPICTGWRLTSWPTTTVRLSCAIETEKT